jgi:spore coat polysaccharide biosynthesis protein SpsF
MIVAIVQARMGSTRLPGKVLADVGGRPMLARTVERLARAARIDRIVVATSSNSADDTIVELCRGLATSVFRGSEHDVLDRYYRAARAHRAQAVVRITGDCPFADACLVDEIVDAFAAAGCDYAANINPPTYPDGLDTEVLTFEALERAWREARMKSEREHVTLYVRNHPELFRMVNVANGEDLSHLRWVVDEPRDLEFARAVYQALPDAPFGWRDILDLINRRPELRRLNQGITRDEGLAKSLAEDAEASSF